MRRFALLLIVSLTSGGCYGTGVPGTPPTVFPNEGRPGGDMTSDPEEPPPGTTVAMMIDSNYLPLADKDEWHDIHPGRIEVWFRDDGNSTPPITETKATVRSVFDLEPDNWSIINLVQPGIWGTVVLFDLPSHIELLGPGIDEGIYPFDVTVFVKVDGMEVQASVAMRETPFTLTSWDGAPQELMWADYWGGQETWLQGMPLSMVRLRGKRIAFEAGQLIGSMEFDFSSSTCDVEVLGARLRSEADWTSNLALVAARGVNAGDPQRVTLISPTGFALTHLTVPVGYFDNTLAGQGPFLDLAIAENDSCDADATDPPWFTIEHLTVTDLDGVAIDPDQTQALDDLTPVGVDYPDAADPDAIFRAYLIDRTPTT